MPLRHSFAFRLGAGFAVAAIAAAGVTAVVVNAAFAARFSQYLAGQQHAQLSAVSAALSRAYAGNGKWDPRALAAVVPAAGPGTVRVVTPSGHDVWQWDGHSMSWNDHWMENGSSGSSQSGGSQSGHDGGGQGSSGHGSSCGSGWDSCAPGTLLGNSGGRGTAVTPVAAAAGRTPCG